MKPLAIGLVFMLQCAHAELNQFASEENGIDPISKISVSGNNIVLSDKTLKGKNFINITLSNNNAKGYKVYLQAKKGFLSPKDKPFQDGEGIDYHLKCDDFTSATGGFIVHASPAINFLPGQETLIYNVHNPINITDNATTRCSLYAAPGERINKHFAGKYTEKISARIENY